MKWKSNPKSKASRGDALKQVTTGLLVCACLCLLAGGMRAASAQTQAEETPLLKAAFIYNFAKFTSWPESAWHQPTSPLNLCTVGKDDLVSELEKLEGKTIQQRSVDVQKLGRQQNSDNCQLLYIATSENRHYENRLQSIQNKPILTVSELSQFAQSGGIIEFHHTKGSTKFVINMAAARKSNLEISSRLLRLADVINIETAP